MPQKNSIKTYYENAFYHVYNRGVEKRDIFLGRDDYLAFLHLLKTALSPPPRQGETLSEERVVRPRRKNFVQKVDLLCYCLLPNHLHLLLRQNDVSATTGFMQSICTAYSMYFNKKYKRVGSLFQGVFKAIDIDDENYLLWLSRYIHRNPENFVSYPYSSYEDYLGLRRTAWVNPKIILDYLSSSEHRKTGNYRRFVEDDIEEPIDLNFYFLEGEQSESPKFRYP